jgi:hypothetical protein
VEIRNAFARRPLFAVNPPNSDSESPTVPTVPTVKPKQPTRKLKLIKKLGRPQKADARREAKLYPGGSAGIRG